MSRRPCCAFCFVFCILFHRRVRLLLFLQVTGLFVSILVPLPLLLLHVHAAHPSFSTVVVVFPHRRRFVSYRNAHRVSLTSSNGSHISHLTHIAAHHHRASPHTTGAHHRATISSSRLTSYASITSHLLTHAPFHAHLSSKPLRPLKKASYTRAASTAPTIGPAQKTHWSLQSFCTAAGPKRSSINGGAS